ncbi:MULTISPECIES: hypothetical protein [unclassified Geodermatophilus]|uniref:hypothetical protein n=1 Tax=unclassified Geodermatophilus TaxID=2637632 RepID=UPI003EE8B09B
MIVQWCIKGLSLPDDASAKRILDDQNGIVCNWWRNSLEIDPQETQQRLSEATLDAHVNHFTTIDPSTGKPYSFGTPFISLSAGTVERDTAARTNWVHRAWRTGLWFGTMFGARDTAYLYTCWCVVAPRPSVPLEGVAEEIRDLNVYRHYSPFQTEGEITAKIVVPDNQIAGCEKWQWNQAARRMDRCWSQPNPRFVPPERLTNVRELL